MEPTLPVWNLKVCEPAPISNALYLSFRVCRFLIVVPLICSVPLISLCIFNMLVDYEVGVIRASAFRTYHTPLNKQVGKFML